MDLTAEPFVFDEFGEQLANLGRAIPIIEQETIKNDSSKTMAKAGDYSDGGGGISGRSTGADYLVCESSEVANGAIIQDSVQPVFGGDSGRNGRLPLGESVGQMPQMPQQANATNATTQTVENAQPSGWGKLWRIEKNGNYYIYRLRFHPDRITRPGGKITAAIETKCHNRKGKGRHKESRQEAERLRSRALDIADRIRRIS